MREIERHNRYRSVRSNMLLGTILDDRARLIDLYDACLQQDAHIRAVIETLESQILGDRYMLARLNDKGKYVKDVKESQKIQGSQFDKIIRGIIEAKLYGYTLLEIMPDIDPDTGRLKEVNSIERRNVLPEQGIVVKRQGLWLPHWDIRSAAYRKRYVLIKTGDLGLFSATTPLILAKSSRSPTTSISAIPTASPSSTERPSAKTTWTASVWRRTFPMPPRTKSS